MTFKSAAVTITAFVAGVLTASLVYFKFYHCAPQSFGAGISPKDHVISIELLNFAHHSLTISELKSKIKALKDGDPQKVELQKQLDNEVKWYKELEGKLNKELN